MKKSAVTLCLLAVLGTLPAAHATGAIAGATLPEQIVQEATQVEQLNNAIQQVQQGFQSLYNQALNLKSLTQNPVPDLNSLLNSLISTAGQASSLSYAGQNITAQFQNLYPGWQPGQDYGQQYQNWNNTTQTNLQNELTAGGLQAQDFQNETAALNSAQQLSQSASGRLQAIQAGTQVSAMMVQQLQMLRQLVLNEQQSQVSYRYQKLQAEQASDNQANQAVQSFVGPGSSSIPSVGSDTVGQAISNYGTTPAP